LDALAAQVSEVVEDAVSFAAQSPEPAALDHGVYRTAIDLYGGRP